MPLASSALGCPGAREAGWSRAGGPTDCRRVGHKLHDWLELNSKPSGDTRINISLSQALNTDPADLPLDLSLRQAVVALVFWHDAGRTHLCLGRRAIHPDDPWSGDLAFPGGKAETIDATLHAVAARETCEEIGLHLPRDALVGRMEQFNAGGARKPTTVWPLIYELAEPPDQFTLSDEMSDAFWAPLDELWNPRMWIAFSFPPTRAQRAGITIGNHFLWGFSLHVLIELSERLGYPLNAIRALETHPHIDCVEADTLPDWQS